MKLMEYFLPAKGTSKLGPSILICSLSLCLHSPLTFAEELIAGRYAVTGTLGEGSTAKVFKAYDTFTKVNVALKHFDSSNEVQTRMKSELEILKDLKQIHSLQLETQLVQFLDHFIWNASSYFVFELLSSNLYEVLEMEEFQGMTLTEVRQLGRNLIQALLVLRMKGIAHLDIKPENIAMVQEPTSHPVAWKLLDFGSAFYVGNRSRCYVGTLPYRAPELFLGLPEINHKADIWSFGCVLFEAYTGYPLFDGNNEVQVMQQIWKYTVKEDADHRQILQSGMYTWMYFTKNYDGVYALRETRLPRRKQGESLQQVLEFSRNFAEEESEWKLFVSLLTKMLVFDATERIDIKELQKHPFWQYV